MAEENRAWGYRRIQGASSNLKHTLARSTMTAILERHGIRAGARAESCLGFDLNESELEKHPGVLGFRKGFQV